MKERAEPEPLRNPKEQPEPQNATTATPREPQPQDGSGAVKPKEMRGRKSDYWLRLGTMAEVAHLTGQQVQSGLLCSAKACAHLEASQGVHVGRPF